MRPEMPYLAAGGVAIVGGAIRDGRWPSEGANAALGTLIVVVAASATADTPIAPLVRAFGLLVLLVAVMTAVRAVNAKKNRKG